jgi:hypothetical protein
MTAFLLSFILSLASLGCPSCGYGHFGNMSPAIKQNFDTSLDKLGIWLPLSNKEQHNKGWPEKITYDSTI